MSINFVLPAVDQDTPLFRLPTELRRRIYQYMLTPSHVHIERKVDYKLTKSGIEVINPGPVTRSKSQRRRAEDESVDMMDLWWSGQPSNHWTCKRIILDQKTRFKINDSASRQDARNALFNVYYCQSQRPGGPSAVPPGYLDHESCRGDREQTPFFGSNLDGLLMTCQWAYMDVRSVGNSVDRSAKVFTPNLSRNDARLELGTHNLHFSDLQDLTCFTELVSLELSESLSNLSVHIDSMESPYWKTFVSLFAHLMYLSLRIIHLRRYNHDSYSMARPSSNRRKEIPNQAILPLRKECPLTDPIAVSNIPSTVVTHFLDALGTE